MSSSKQRNVIRQYRFLPLDVATIRDALELGDGSEDAAEPAVTVQTVPQPANDAAIKAAEETAAALLAQAQQEAERICAEATDQADTIRRQAEAAGREEGFEAGCRDGRAVLEAELTEEVAIIRNMADAILEERRRMLAELEGEVIDLVMAIAHKVIGDLAASQAEVVHYLCQQAIDQLGQSGNVHVHVNPQDAERLAAFWAATGPAAGELEVDERVTPGGCTVTSGASLVDARIDSQLGLIQQAFRSLRGG